MIQSMMHHFACLCPALPSQPISVRIVLTFGGLMLWSTGYPTQRPTEHIQQSHAQTKVAKTSAMIGGSWLDKHKLRFS
ncbi:hypothetical protein BDV36DRAFT_261339 [Aspergillus pseudocaelatus]|uniref:Secreted protein n=1 Tax=Aspergillus pseudocaelatus TaxID=1825620 RepID=A0ABQ6WFW9_9EURO|nr:hypothetical protein BDV36DRAFT_261339 [Aspergillus pseudocaelatus]